MAVGVRNKSPLHPVNQLPAWRVGSACLIGSLVGSMVMLVAGCGDRSGAASEVEDERSDAGAD